MQTQKVMALVSFGALAWVAIYQHASGKVGTLFPSRETGIASVQIGDVIERMMRLERGYNPYYFPRDTCAGRFEIAPFCSEMTNQKMVEMKNGNTELHFQFDFTESCNYARTALATLPTIGPELSKIAAQDMTQYRVFQSTLSSEASRRIDNSERYFAAREAPYIASSARNTELKALLSRIAKTEIRCHPTYVSLTVLLTHAVP
jgi:hypothetical protein